MTRRAVAAAVLAVAIVTGLLVHLLGSGGPAADVAGTALYAGAVYALLVLVAPRLPPGVTGSIAAVWCAGVELLQLTGLPTRLADAFPPAALVLGTVYDTGDLVVLLVSVFVATGIDAAVRAARPGATP